ncbi:hypothetical protein GK0764 [Geobacillus kaustophilus HTA426]|uniref:Uncharacterized protein n=1 Tax=Geobacillus kaustophilus (strain HTA426) TaxID=235909 RepID=Q5L1Y1_GEOKA|nr:hypothetical protein GK0764 [Geobacillus kaustophilus HTA426]
MAEADTAYTFFQSEEPSLLYFLGVWRVNILYRLFRWLSSSPMVRSPSIVALLWM